MDFNLETHRRSSSSSSSSRSGSSSSSLSRSPSSSSRSLSSNSSSRLRSSSSPPPSPRCSSVQSEKRSISLLFAKRFASLTVLKRPNRGSPSPGSATSMMYCFSRTKSPISRRTASSTSGLSAASDIFLSDRRAVLVINTYLPVLS
ncbi:MAG TPA: hypothetical protein EYG25_02330 [Candidatus Poseidoniales archaeon]|uniref:Uncharacterized protein n=1 Tax=Marine Group III euryarchaeote TaxID=2173149 RepID=A0A7C7ZEB5_9ARCH|nr:hypothetical protein [Marine Group III euryarchaeote]HIL33109.1 hypothetical protein [Candidatus Poseidoniales archaeon]